MTGQKLQILQHALGVDEHGRGQMYRNHFAAGGEDVRICQELIELGYMRQVATNAVFPDFNCRVTEAGKSAMLAESPKPPKLTRSQRRYREWFDSGAADCGWKFGDWLKRKDDPIEERIMDQIYAEWGL